MFDDNEIGSGNPLGIFAIFAIIFFVLVLSFFASRNITRDGKKAISEENTTLSARTNDR